MQSNLPTPECRDHHQFTGHRPVRPVPDGQEKLMQTPVILASEPGASMAPGSLAEAASRPAVEISHLRKTYGPLVAVDDVSFSVTEGEIFGILGPNGAGKTTTVECAIGLRSPDSGTVRLMGIDPQADKAQVHQTTGVQLQSGAFPAKLRVGEIIDMYRSFYRHPADVGELAGALGLGWRDGDCRRGSDFATGVVRGLTDSALIPRLACDGDPVTRPTRLPITSAMGARVSASTPAIHSDPGRARTRRDCQHAAFRYRSFPARGNARTRHRRPYPV